MHLLPRILRTTASNINKLSSMSTSLLISGPADCDFVKTDAETKQKSSSSVKSQLPHELNSVLRDEEWGTRILKDEEEVFTLNAW